MTKILTVENQSYNLDMVPEEIEDIRYCVLDYSDPKNADYIFVLSVSVLKRLTLWTQQKYFGLELLFPSWN